MRRSFRTKALAVRLCEKMIAQLHADEFAEIVAVSWEKLTTEFLDAKEGDQLSTGSMKEYRQAFKDFSGANFDPPSNHIDPRSIERLKKAVSQNSPATINKKLRHLSCMFNWAVTHRYLLKNPISRSSKLRETKRVYHVMTKEEFSKVLESCPNDQWRLLIQLAVHGAGRKQDLIDLEIEAIDFGAGVVKVYRSKQREEAVIPIHPHTLSELANFVSDIPIGQKRLFTCGFSNNSWRVILKRAEVPYSRFHDLRAAMVSWMAAAGVPSSVPSKIFSHSPGVTERYYTQLNLKVFRDAINRLPIP